MGNRQPAPLERKRVRILHCLCQAIRQYNYINVFLFMGFFPACNHCRPRHLWNTFNAHFGIENINEIKKELKWHRISGGERPLANAGSSDWVLSRLKWSSQEESFSHMRTIDLDFIPIVVQLHEYLIRNERGATLATDRLIHWMHLCTEIHQIWKLLFSISKFFVQIVFQRTNDLTRFVHRLDRRIRNWTWSLFGHFHAHEMVNYI